ncbi:MULTISPECIES: ABC transporter ATP-binding protein [Afifella]|uniref:ABC transporter ATP-binding protein n=1 Tax=Afifella TaxID=643217 RepID=UPI0013E3E74B|nr:MULTISPECIES: ABC transporter ATP-binding protein [Afifella]MCT8267054.1 ABC transporter ATP-binding protein/permease [Afifella sp. JA880]
MTQSGSSGEISRDGGSDTLTVEDISAYAVMRRLLVDILWPHRRVLFVALISMVVGAATSGAVPFLIQVVADEVFVAKNEMLLYLLPVAIILVMGVRGVADWTSKVTDAWLGNKVVSELRIRMFETLTKADLAWVERTHSGRFVSAFVNDADIVQRAAAKTMTALVKDSLTVLFLTASMFYMDWRLALLVCAGMPFAYLYLTRQRKRISGSVRRSLKEAGDLGSMLTQTLQSLRVVKAYRQEQREAERFHVIVDNIVRYLMKTARSRAAVGPVTETLSGVGIAAAIFYGGWQGIYGNVSLGHFAGFLTAAMLTYPPMRTLAQTQAQLSEGVTAASRIFAVIDHSAIVAEKPGAKPLNVREARIRFEHVDFSYDNGTPVLRDFDLSIEPGQKVALVGPSGAGKSTVLNLALRFFDPSGGRILIDGQDVRDVTLPSVRGASALLTQDPVLFDETIRTNIAYGSEEASQEQIIEAAKAAAAHDFISRLPNGYETHVGEAGGRLSGGERQRVAFARAMLRDAPILLLDEPTSALDAEAEAKVQTALDGLLKGRTVLMIAHRLSTVKRADLICVMVEGRIVERGSHHELIAKNGAYARMFHTQFVGEAPALAAAGR